MISLPDIQSSLIKSIEYDEENCEITFFFVEKYFETELTYIDFTYIYFEELINSKSIGKFYLHFITHNFKLKTMADNKKAPTTKNQSSNKKRWITMRINVDEINKDWIFPGEKGNYLDITLGLLPDGEVDKYGSLGMVTQKVPPSVYKEDKKAQGSILGNGYEYDWAAGGGGTYENRPDTELKGKLSQEEIDDLPF